NVVRVTPHEYPGIGVFLWKGLEDLSNQRDRFLFQRGPAGIKQQVRGQTGRVLEGAKAGYPAGSNGRGSSLGRQTLAVRRLGVQDIGPLGNQVSGVVSSVPRNGGGGISLTRYFPDDQ